jgi:membrane protease YdiL (CAAX protease family)
MVKEEIVLPDQLLSGSISKRYHFFLPESGDTHKEIPMPHTETESAVLSFAKQRPVLTFLLINFAWTWLFWLLAIPFGNCSDLLVNVMVIIGGFGPALAGVITLGMRSDEKFGFSARQWITFLLASGLIFGVISLRYRAGNIAGFSTLAEDLTLSWPIVAAAVFASLVGGWVISSAVSEIQGIRERMASILPWRAAPGWTLFGILFYPALILLAWGLGSLLGLGVEFPALWNSSLREVLPLYLLTFAVTFLVQGGNEEPGWRGFMQPELQRTRSPLVSALIVAVFWSLWHLPLYLNGFYPGSLVGGMISGFIFRVLLSIFLAWFYDRSKGNLFAVIFLHASFNMIVNYLPTSDAGLTILWILIAAILVVLGKMYRKPSAQGGTA